MRSTNCRNIDSRKSDDRKMNDRKWNKNNRRMAAGILAALVVTAVCQTTPQVVYGAGLEEAIEYPTGGLMEMVTETVVDTLSDGQQTVSSLRSIRPNLCQYDWDCYSSDYYYSKLSSREQLLYERLDAACGELLASAAVDAETYKVKVKAGGGYKTLERKGTKMVSTMGLTTDQVKKVQTLFVYANPQYYFLNTTMMEKPDDSTCALGVYEKFASGGERAAVTAEVGAKLEELQAQIDDMGSVFETEAQIHDLICDVLTYMQGDGVLADATDPYFTQTIYGALMNGKTVCAGYTKLYTMLCNYFGIDCISVSSTDHAWNEVRYGDQWYLVDVTWDDTRDRGKFFHITDKQMKAMDQNNSHVPYSFYDGIRPAANAAFAEELKAMAGLAQPKVEITDTAPGVKIEMEAAEGEIYYTLDGTAPGADDLYTEPIELTDGGTYIVTAMTAGDGWLPSAYEIFPVRIAGGSVSVGSAVNFTGKKIKVTCKTSKTYVGYEISYASKKDFSNQKSARVKGKTATIKGLKKGKTYYVRVRGYKIDSYGNYYYTPYSKMKKVTITK